MHAYDAGGSSDDALSTYIWFAAELMHYLILKHNKTVSLDHSTILLKVFKFLHLFA